MEKSTETPQGQSGSDAAPTERERFDLNLIQCHACKLCEDCRAPVPGAGRWDSRIVIIGEAPGWTEDKNGLPFIGMSGGILRDTTAALGLSVGKHTFITNVVKCRPKNNRTPTDAEAKFCAERWLYRELDNIAPEAVLILGRVAQRILLPNAVIPEGGSMEQNGLRCYYLHHPSYWGRAANEMYSELCENPLQEYVKWRVAPHLKSWIIEWRRNGWL